MVPDHRRKELAVRTNMKCFMEVVIFVLQCIYTVTVCMAALATVILNVLLVGNPGGLTATYALIGMIVITRWLFVPKKRQW
jgi:hypothetical protein